jgi:hypothetical protein
MAFKMTLKRSMEGKTISGKGNSTAMVLRSLVGWSGHCN